MNSNNLSAADIDDAADLETKDVGVPEWSKEGKPGLIRLHQLNAEESNAMYALIDLPEHKKDGMFLILIYCARDPETGIRLWPFEGTPEEQHDQIVGHVRRLKKKSARVMNRLQKVALQLNRLRDADEVTLKKDSSEAVTGDSPTDSHVS